MRFARSRRTDAVLMRNGTEKSVRTHKNTRAHIQTQQTDAKPSDTIKTLWHVYVPYTSRLAFLYIWVYVYIYFNYGSENLISRFPNGRMQSPPRSCTYRGSPLPPVASLLPHKLSSPPLSRSLALTHASVGHLTAMSLNRRKLDKLLYYYILFRSCIKSPTMLITVVADVYITRSCEYIYVHDCRSPDRCAPG